MMFTRLWPDRQEVNVAELLGGWQPHAAEGSELPRVAVNFAVTADGAVALSEGKSGGIGAEGDLEMFKALRDRVDAIMAGTSTIEIERYRRTIRDAGRRSAREAAGLAAQPLAVTISRSGNLPLSTELFTDPQQPVVAYVDEAAASQGDLPPGVELVGLNPVEPRAALVDLASRGVRSVLCEGGATLVGALARSGLIDDIFVTIAPKLAGGGPAGLTSGPPLDTPSALQLAHLAEHDGYLFIRWSRT
jgi:riboflavin-specific deaminase-like protein